jgi:hypothetical protein
MFLLSPAPSFYWRGGFSLLNNLHVASLTFDVIICARSRGIWVWFLGNTLCFSFFADTTYLMYMSWFDRTTMK